jgi:hypothetical protein
MAATHVGKQRSKRSRRRSGPSYGAIGAVVGVAAFVAAVGVVLIVSSGGGSAPTIGSPTADTAAAASSALQPTGEVSSMGVPVVETPGYASGAAKVEGIAVQGADWALGQVPLDVAVRPFWTLTNTGGTKVTLGEPKAEVREGCCPGPFELGSHTLAPGESTVLTFELSMHEGMDGWHDMGVYVPVSGSAGDQLLELNVTGDFRN